MTLRTLTALAATLLLAAPALVTPAWAATEHFHADMLGPSEVPANATAGTGTVDATLDTATKKLDYKVTWSGLTGPATMAHIHGPAPAGKNAGVIVPLGDSPSSPITGSAPLTDAQVAALENGMYYVNVHTDAHKGGEIRGQLLKAP
jgi:CHRD domain